MSELNEKYKVSIAKSNKKTKNIVDAFKIRRNGNSSIVTIPEEVKEELNIKDGDQVQYVTVRDEDDSPIVMIRKVKNDGSNDEEVDKEVKELFKESLEKYNDIITALAEL